MIRNTLIFIGRRPPPPAPQPVCERIATNQRVAPNLRTEPLDDTPGSGTWTGAGGATGIHQAYEYVDIGGGVEQQFIVMSEVVGSFVDGEVLTGTPA